MKYNCGPETVLVMSNYLSRNKNDDYVDLLNYLAESDPVLEVRKAANQALVKIKQSVPAQPPQKS